MQPDALTLPSGQAVNPFDPFQPPALAGTAQPPTQTVTGAGSMVVSGTDVLSMIGGTGGVSMTWGNLVAASANVGVVGLGDLGQLASVNSLGFVILTNVAAPSQSNTDLYRRAPMLNLPFPFPTLSFAPEPVRYLTIEEQGVFHRALRRSARLIHKAKRAS
jgi:hypothetical protein